MKILMTLPILTIVLTFLILWNQWMKIWESKWMIREIPSSREEFLKTATSNRKYTKTMKGKKFNNFISKFVRRLCECRNSMKVTQEMRGQLLGLWFQIKSIRGTWKDWNSSFTKESSRRNHCRILRRWTRWLGSIILNTRAGGQLSMTTLMTPKVGSISTRRTSCGRIVMELK